MFMLSSYGRRQWLTVAAMGVMLTATLAVCATWWASVLAALATLGLLSFFRDPDRRIPTQRSIMVSPADGHVSAIENLEWFDFFGEPALCVRIFLSVFDVHINRSPCHGLVASISPKRGAHLSALKPRSARLNSSNLILVRHPTNGRFVAAVRQVAGALARTIICRVRPDQIVQRGQRIGMIVLGSTTELYVPASLQPQAKVAIGQKVRGGQTVLVTIKSAPGRPTPDGVSNQPADGTAADSESDRHAAP